MTDSAGYSSLEPTALSVRQKRCYLMAVATVASSDQDVSPEELTIVKDTATALNVRLLDNDLREHSVEEIARILWQPPIRAAVFADVIRMARADRKLEPQELQLIGFFAERWGQDLPELPDVNWSEVTVPGSKRARRKLDRERREAMKSRKKVLASADPGTDDADDWLSDPDVDPQRSPLSEWLIPGLVAGALLVFMVVGFVLSGIEPDEVAKSKKEDSPKEEEDDDAPDGREGRAARSRASSQARERSRTFETDSQLAAVATFDPIVAFGAVQSGQVHEVALWKNLVLTGGDDKRVKLWSLDAQLSSLGPGFSVDERMARERLVSLRGTGEHADKVHCVAFSPDGGRALSGDAQGKAVLWRIQLDAEHKLQEIARWDTGHGKVHAVAFALGGRLLTAGGDGAWRVWEPKPQGSPKRIAEQAQLDEAISAVFTDDAGDWVLLAGRFLKPPTLFQLSDAKPVAHPFPRREGDRPGFSVASDQTWAVTAGRNSAQVWAVDDPPKVEPLVTLPHPVQRGNTPAVIDVALAGRWVLTVRRTARLFRLSEDRDAVTGILQVRAGHPVALAPDADWAATQDETGRVSLRRVPVQGQLTIGQDTITWAASAKRGARDGAKLEVGQVEVEQSEQEVRLDVSLKNTGDGPAHLVQGLVFTASQPGSGTLGKHRVFFGRVDPGQSVRRRAVLPKADEADAKVRVEMAIVYEGQGIPPRRVPLGP